MKRKGKVDRLKTDLRRSLTVAIGHWKRRHEFLEGPGFSIEGRKEWPVVVEVTAQLGWPRDPGALSRMSDDLLALADEACSEHGVSVDMGGGGPASARDFRTNARVERWRLSFAPLAKESAGAMRHLRPFG